MLDHLFQKRSREQAEHEEFIAHEIHDGACQYAIAARMALDAFRHQKTEAGSENWGSFDTATKFLDRTIEELRRLVRGLQPIQLAAGGLPAAIAYLIEEIQTAGGPDTEFRHDIHPDQIPSRLRRAAFRIVQESLANACRHSKSKRLFVELTLDGDVLRIRVRDWGVGFDPDSTPPGHFGLNGIRRRVKLLRGTTTIDSESGKGTCVTVELPLQRPE
ncbi:MAG: sensor histidine kinase [Thermoguttaceae bacterium]|jgi:signal transduction histidine kinase